MKSGSYLVGLIALTVLPAFGQGPVTGDTFADMLRDAPPLALLYMRGYLDGWMGREYTAAAQLRDDHPRAVRTLKDVGAICIPRWATAADANTLVLQHLGKEPLDQLMTAPGLINKVLLKAWPCLRVAE